MSKVSPSAPARKLEPDTDVARGDVHVTTPRGLLVRELDEALEAIHENLLGEVQ